MALRLLFWFRRPNSASCQSKRASGHGDKASSKKNQAESEEKYRASTILEVAPRREKCRIEKDRRKKEFEGDRRIQNQSRQTRQQAEGQATKYQENFYRHAGTARPGNGHRCNEQEQQRSFNDTHRCARTLQFEGHDALQDRRLLR